MPRVCQERGGTRQEYRRTSDTGPSECILVRWVHAGAQRVRAVCWDLPGGRGYGYRCGAWGRREAGARKARVEEEGRLPRVVYTVVHGRTLLRQRLLTADLCALCWTCAPGWVQAEEVHGCGEGYTLMPRS